MYTSLGGPPRLKVLSEVAAWGGYPQLLGTAFLPLVRLPRRDRRRRAW
jgi:hypothetical protein